MSEATLPLPLEALSIASTTAPASEATDAQTPETTPGAGDFTALLARELSPENEKEPQQPELAVISATPVAQEEAVLPLPDGKVLPPEGGMFLPQVPLARSSVADTGDLSADDRVLNELPVASLGQPKPPVFGKVPKTVVQGPTSAAGEELSLPGRSMTPGEKASVPELPQLAERATPEPKVGEEALPKLSFRDAVQVSGNKEPVESPLLVSSRPTHHPNPEASDRTSVLSPRFELPEPVRTQQWNQSLGNRIVWMANGHVQRAELHLNPPELGSLEVRVAVNQDETRVFFTAQHAAAREAVDAALPRLREMMGTAGLNLVQVDVSQQGLAKHGQASGSEEAVADLAEAISSDADAADTPVLTTASRRHDGLFDDYA